MWIKHELKSKEKQFMWWHNRCNLLVALVYNSICMWALVAANKRKTWLDLGLAFLCRVTILANFKMIFVVWKFTVPSTVSCDS